MGNPDRRIVLGGSMATATEELSHDASDAELEKLFEEFPVSSVAGGSQPQVDPAIAAMKGPPSALKVLSRATAFVKAHPSAALTGDLRIEAADQPGSSTSMVLRFHVEGV